MIVNIFIITCLLSIYSCTDIDYCYLPCKDPFTSAIIENTACNCNSGPSCGKSLSILPPTLKEKEYITDIHNEIRNKLAGGNETRGGNTAASNMAAVVYDDSIEHVAQCHANQCMPSTDECRRTERFLMIGQNFYLTYGDPCQSTAVFKAAIDTWHEDVSSTNKLCLEQYTGCASHYTQIIWADTTNIGCGRVLFGDICHIFCNYGPTGNINGQSVYISGKPNCIKYHDKYKNLCAVNNSLHFQNQSRNVKSSSLLRWISTMFIIITDYILVYKISFSYQ